MKKILYTVIAAAVLAGCAKEQADSSGLVAVTFDKISITRATATAWETGDRIGVYMATSGAASLEDSNLAQGARNIPYTTQQSGATGTFTPASPNELIYYPVDGSEVDFYAYYPYREGITDGLYPVDVSDQTTPAAIDLLTAKTTGKSKKTPAVALQFTHSLSKLTFFIKAGDELTATDLQGIAVTVKGFVTKADYNLADGTMNNYDIIQDITMPVSADGARAGAILIPSGFKENAEVVFKLVNGVEYSWPIAANSFLQGKDYQYTATLNRSRVDVSSVNIEGWLTERATISYDMNGGTGLASDFPSAKVIIGEKYTIPNRVPYKENVVFAGWAATADANAQSRFYQPGESFTVKGDISGPLYAIWGTAIPRLTVVGGSDGKPMLITTTDPNAPNVYFKYGSVIGFDKDCKVIYNPTDKTFTYADVPISDYGIKNLDANYQTVKNVSMGRGDPCCLVELTQEQIKSGVVNNKKWRLPSATECRNMAGTNSVQALDGYPGRVFPNAPSFPQVWLASSGGYLSYIGGELSANDLFASYLTSSTESFDGYSGFGVYQPTTTDRTALVENNLLRSHGHLVFCVPQ